MYRVGRNTRALLCVDFTRPSCFYPYRNNEALVKPHDDKNDRNEIGLCSRDARVIRDAIGFGCVVTCTESVYREEDWTGGDECGSRHCPDDGEIVASRQKPKRVLPYSVGPSCRPNGFRRRTGPERRKKKQKSSCRRASLAGPKSQNGGARGSARNRVAAAAVSFVVRLTATSRPLANEIACSCAAI